MENKKTTELLDLLTTLVDKDGNLKDGWSEARDEIMSRDPFYEIFKSAGIGGNIEQRLDDMEETIKLLKRHKHDSTTGDVMARI